MFHTAGTSDRRSGAISNDVGDGCFSNSASDRGSGAIISGARGGYRYYTVDDVVVGCDRDL